MDINANSVKTDKSEDTVGKKIKNRTIWFLFGLDRVNIKVATRLWNFDTRVTFDLELWPPQEISVYIMNEGDVYYLHVRLDDPSSKTVEKSMLSQKWLFL